MKNIFWIAGEKSGDLHAGEVMRELNAKSAELNHVGIGGEKMEEQGLQPIFDFQRFAVMGFVEVIKHLKFFSKVEKKIKQMLRENPPDLVVLVDYPGLNMRIAKYAKELGIKVLYFICPQFWAWKKKRIFKLKEYTDHICYILPFEGEYFRKHNIAATYVGHPIAEEIKLKISKEEFAHKYNLDLNKRWIGFFPGSRNSEIERILPEYVRAIQKFPKADYQFLISRASSVNPEIFQKCLGKLPAQTYLINADNYEMMKYCNCLSVTSGTATLETAYLETPFIIVYKTAPISYFIGKNLVNITRIGLPNIILDEDLLPELIQDDVSAQNIMENMEKLLKNKNLFDGTKAKLKKIHKVLGKSSASKKTAEIIFDLIGD